MRFKIVFTRILFAPPGRFVPCRTHLLRKGDGMHPPARRWGTALLLSVLLISEPVLFLSSDTRVKIFAADMAQAAVHIVGGAIVRSQLSGRRLPAACAPVHIVGSCSVRVPRPLTVLPTNSVEEPANFYPLKIRPARPAQHVARVSRFLKSLLSIDFPPIAPFYDYLAVRFDGLSVKERRGLENTDQRELHVINNQAHHIAYTLRIDTAVLADNTEDQLIRLFSLETADLADRLRATPQLGIDDHGTFYTLTV